MKHKKLLALSIAAAFSLPVSAATQDPDQRAAAVVAKMTMDEKIATVFG